MDILYYGTLGETGVKLCNYLSKGNSVTAYADNRGRYELECGVLSGKEMTVEQAIKQTAPQVMICYEIWEQACEALYDTMKYAKLNGVRNFIILREADFFRKKENSSDLLNIICRDCETDLFKPHIIVISTLYGDATVPAYLDKLNMELQGHNEILFPESDSVYCDCLHIDDFCKLMSVLLGSDMQELPLEIQLQSSYPFKMERFIELFSKKHPQAVCDRKDNVEENSNLTFASVPGWMPEHNFLQEISDVFEMVELSTKAQSESHRSLLISRSAKITAFIVAFGAIELYLNFVPAASELQFVDFRLLLIICTGLFAGKKNSIFAAALCSISSIVHCLISGTKWYVIFYHIDNWIPMAVYFIAAMLAGIFYEKYCETGKKNEGSLC